MTSEKHTSPAKTVLVTGSGRRLGRQIAYAFASAGFDVALHARTSVDGMHEAARNIEAMGRQAWCFHADLSIVEEIRRLADEVSATIPCLDVLVNNAGVFPEAVFEDVTEELWDLALDTNARSMFFLTQALSGMLRTSRGSVVNIASIGGLQPWKNAIPYNVSKVGVIMLTRALAKTLAPDVRVNAVAPGIILVPDEEQRDHIPASRIPLQRYGTPKDLTDAVLFLATTQYITGHVIPVDGGSHSSAV